jgi:hypothetical protein
MTHLHDIRNTGNASPRPGRPGGVQAVHDPNLMTPRERIREIGEILAAGILRLRDRESAGRARP